MKLTGEEERRSGRFQAWWAGLGPKKQRAVLLGALGIVIVLISLLGYRKEHGSRPERPRRTSEKKVISFDSTLFEKSIYAEAQRKLRAQQQQIEALKKEVEELKKARLEEPPVPPPPPPEVPSRPPQPQTGASPPGSGAGFAVPPPPPPGSPSGPKKYAVLGEIGLVRGERPKKAEEKKKDQGMRIYLPPSFMEATLLSGITAPATAEGRKHPVPVLLRIKDLAVLPNRVKANLKGCFVIGEAIGNLADERVHVRLTTLSCVAKNGSAVIDQTVKGFLVDEDGKVGLKGIVVSKMGSLIARAALAGFFEGLGEGVQMATYDFQMTPTGTGQFISSTEAENIAQAGIGKAMSSAAKELRDFYLDLARQTLPVIEVGATKDVTVVISQGVELRIRNQRVLKESER